MWQASENLSGSSFVRTVDMGWLTATLTDHLDAAEAADPARAARRQRFLMSARPALDRVYRLAGVLLGNATEAEDAVQDSLIVAWQQFDELRELDRFGAWLDRIVVNGCRDRLRRRGTIRFIPLAVEVDPAGRDPFVAFLERDALVGAIGQLTVDERIVVVLRFWADLSLEAIAERQGWPLGTVKSRLHRALGRLREMHDREPSDATEARR
jgi:RNA polymerase sigma-70 factor, ECF subfamily